MSNLPTEKRSRRKPEVKSWVVTMECVVTKSVVLEACTEQQAWEDPWDYAQEETEVDQKDWEVLKVEPNE